MRLCTCLWGGIFNPIIPVSRSLPKAWSRRPYGRPSGTTLSEGYLRFFEPDVIVEASPGLANKLAIDSDSPGSFRDRVVSLTEFVRREEGRRADFAFGVNVHDLYTKLYSTEFRFVPKHERRPVFFEKSSRDDAFIEAVFGMFPREGALEYIEQGYLRAFDPIHFRATPQAWLRIINEAMETPFVFGSEHLTRAPHGWDEPSFFVLDPASTPDLIDFWNLRQFRRQVLPIHVGWIDDVKDYLQERIERNFRPLPRNPYGVMIRTTVEFSQSIPEDRAKEITRKYLSTTPKDSYSVKYWYNSIWTQHHDDMVFHPKRAMISAKSVDHDHTLEGEGLSVRIPTIAPEFVEETAHRASWANVLTLREYGSKRNIALTFPSNTKNPHFPRLRSGDLTIVSREGIVLHKSVDIGYDIVRLMYGRDALIGWFEENKVSSVHSEPGRIAEQIISSIGGLWNARLFADKETLHLLDKMAKSVRVRSDQSGSQTEEEYADRTAQVQEWSKILRRRKREKKHRNIDLDSFVDAGVIRLGLVAQCNSCGKRNWYSLEDIKYEVDCDRCLQKFRFPQGPPRFDESLWRYRVVGPFTAPNFAEGGYGTALTLRAFSHLLGMGEHVLTYTTGLNIEVGDSSLEVDFAFWYQRQGVSGLNESEEPELVLGEAKSFAVEGFQAREIRRLRRIGVQFPGAYLVVATLKDGLSKGEKERVRDLALWGRQPLQGGQLRAPVIVLTGTELFADWSIEHTWEDAGGRHAEIAKSYQRGLDNLRRLADCTQQIYLELDSIDQWLREHYQKKYSKRRQEAQSA